MIIFLHKKGGTHVYMCGENNNGPQSWHGSGSKKESIADRLGRLGTQRAGRATAECHRTSHSWYFAEVPHIREPRRAISSPFGKGVQHHGLQSEIQRLGEWQSFDKPLHRKKDGGDRVINCVP